MELFLYSIFGLFAIKSVIRLVVIFGTKAINSNEIVVKSKFYVVDSVIYAAFAIWAAVLIWY